jgi:hypothetical protein
MEIIASLTHRRETFLSLPEWVERPWKVSPKTLLDELLDPLFDVPAIYQQSDELSHETDQILLQDGFRSIIAKCLKVEYALRSLYENFEKSASGPLYWPELSTLESPLDDTSSGKVFPVSFHFPAFFVAQVSTTYWSGMMAVHHQLMYAYNKLAAIESSTTSSSINDVLLRQTSAGNGIYSVVPSDLRSREHSDKWKSMVKNICQSVEYYLQDKMGWPGPISILPLLGGCKSCLESIPEDWSREIGWITETIGRVVKKFDFPVSGVFER